MVHFGEVLPEYSIGLSEIEPAYLANTAVKFLGLPD
jgi:hypothetical protein